MVYKNLPKFSTKLHKGIYYRYYIITMHIQDFNIKRLVYRLAYTRT